MTPSEKDLLDFISGIGPTGKGLYTYPDGNENHKAIHGICLSLERQAHQ